MHNVQLAMNQIPITSPENILPSEALDHVNNLYNVLCKKIHASVESSLPEKPHPLGNTNKWWNKECTRARNHNKLFHCIWKSCGSPVSGVIHECHKAARKSYRRCCRQAVNMCKNEKFRLIDKLYHERNLKNIIRKSKQNTSACGDYNAISMDKHVEHFENKFAVNKTIMSNLTQCEIDVERKYDSIRNCEMSEFIIPELTIRHYIKRLKPRAAPGTDGITGEHLKTAMNSLFSTCVRFGVLPDHFCHGLLIPILKKRTLNPSIPKSYRPITVSAIVSKILEQYIIDNCDEYRHNEAQFGFITNRIITIRSTSMASALAHDIGIQGINNILLQFGRRRHVRCVAT